MLNPYLFYQDKCEAAFNYYARVLGGRIDAMLRSEEAPPEMPAAPGREKTVMHARMSLPDGSILMASDAPPEHRKDSLSLSRSRIQPKPSASSARSPMAAPSPCPSARPFGPRALARASTSSVSRGW